MSAETARDVIETVDDNWRHPSDKCDRSGFGDAILSALRSAGWAVVPVEATEGMCSAFDNVPWRTLAVGLANHEDEAKAAWRAMLKAAQEDSRE